MSVRDLGWNRVERRPRAPLRLLGTLVFLAVATVGTGALVYALALPFAFESVGTAGTAVVTAVGAVFAVFASAVLLDRRPLADYGFHLGRRWGADLAVGLALGGVLLTLVFLVALAAGWVAVVGTFRAPGAFLPALAGNVLVFCLVGLYEELLVRGYLLRNLAEGLAGYVSEQWAVGASVLFSSAVFGALHLGNPNATLVSALGITLAGVMLAAGFVFTGELALPIGLHVTWNVFQGLVFGFPVSGLTVGTTLLATREQGPDLLTGGSFGPEAGLLGVLATLVGLVSTLWYVRRAEGAVRIHDRVTTPRLRWWD
ncbi:CPBP family intramembrane glutamic endopeptidase [Halomarina litorea]|uniref:CPBP family intramembrane glutamic endopeptidase n=1 Tax=Halomarina litorea TaxID=2961595 RepID=UPI0020C4A3BE|nr:type II CAAX endopeptidase family protein [Halomarina sp. BCD28]